MPHARERFVRWVQSTGKSNSAIGRELKCSGAYVGYLLAGKRTKPGLQIAHAIKLATLEWEEGPILPEEWLVLEAAGLTDSEEEER